MLEQIELTIRESLNSGMHQAPPSDVQQMVQLSAQPEPSCDPTRNVSSTTGLFITGPEGCGKTTLLKAVNEKLSPQYDILHIGAGVAISQSPLGQHEYLMKTFVQSKISPEKYGKLLLIDGIDEWCKSNSLMSMLVSILRMDKTATFRRVFVIATLNSTADDSQNNSVTLLKHPGRSFFSTITMRSLAPEEKAYQLANLIRSSKTAFQFGNSGVIPNESSSLSRDDPQVSEQINTIAKEISRDTMVIASAFVLFILYSRKIHITFFFLLYKSFRMLGMSTISRGMPYLLKKVDICRLQRYLGVMKACQQIYEAVAAAARGKRMNFNNWLVVNMKIFLENFVKVY